MIAMNVNEFIIKCYDNFVSSGWKNPKDSPVSICVHTVYSGGYKFIQITSKFSSIIYIPDVEKQKAGFNGFIMRTTDNVEGWEEFDEKRNFPEIPDVEFIVSGIRESKTSKSGNGDLL